MRESLNKKRIFNEIMHQIVLNTIKKPIQLLFNRLLFIFSYRFVHLQDIPIRSIVKSISNDIYAINTLRLNHSNKKNIFGLSGAPYYRQI